MCGHAVVGASCSDSQITYAPTLMLRHIYLAAGGCIHFDPSLFYRIKKMVCVCDVRCSFFVFACGLVVSDVCALVRIVVTLVYAHVVSSV